jgi:hypothetical protein
MDYIDPRNWAIFGGGQQPPPAVNQHFGPGPLASRDGEKPLRDGGIGNTPDVLGPTQPPELGDDKEEAAKVAAAALGAVQQKDGAKTDDTPPPPASPELDLHDQHHDPQEEWYVAYWNEFTAWCETAWDAVCNWFKEFVECFKGQS